MAGATNDTNQVGANSAARARVGAAVLLGGSFAGIALLFLEQLALRLTAGYWVPVALHHVVSYLLSGLAVGFLSGLVLRVWRGGKAIDRLLQVASCSLALLCLPSIAERVHHAGRSMLGQPLLGIAVVLVCAGFLVWWAILRAVLGERRGAWSGLLAALTAVSGLAINRNVVASPLEPTAIAADLGVVILVLTLALVVRRAHAKALVIGGVLALLLCLLIPALLSRLPTAPTIAPIEGSNSPPPHLLLLVIDTLREDTFAEVLAETPEGQRFARAMSGSARFPRAIAAAPWTAPSMGSILSGYYPREHGFIKPQRPENPAPFRRIGDEVPLLAEQLRGVGYETHSIIANPILHPETGLARGFDDYRILAGPTVKLPLLTALSAIGAAEVFTYQPAMRVRRATLRKTRSLDRTRPHFLWIHWMDPHSPLAEHDLPEAEGEQALPKLDFLYRREVRYTLDQVAATIEGLQEQGVWDQSLVVLVSDHGEMFPSDGRDHTKYGKRYGHGHALYDELVHIPLMIRPPGGLAEDRVSRHLVHHVDLHDTILDLLDIPTGRVPRMGADRVSLAALLRDAGATPSPRESAMSEATDGRSEQRALRTAEWKVIDHLANDEGDELYDLPIDPGETTDLSQDRPDILAELRLRLTDFWHGLRDPPATEDVDLDEQTRRQLEALGYL